MKPITSRKPTASEIAPARIESAPSSGPTLRSSTTVSGAGSAPARSSTARSLADWALKLPLIWPRPPVIGSRITGALITWLSSTMAKRWLTLARVTSAKRRAPTELKVKFTTQSPVCGLVPARASVRSPPSTSTRRRTAIFWFGWFCIGRNSSPGGGGPLAAGLALSSTSWNVMCAVLPSSSLIRFGSSMPGSWTTMRSLPWRVICGSTTPVSSMRRRTISIDCCTAAVARSFSATGDRVSVICPSGVGGEVDVRAAGGIVRCQRAAGARRSPPPAARGRAAGAAPGSGRGCAVSVW